MDSRGLADVELPAGARRSTISRTPVAFPRRIRQFRARRNPPRGTILVAGHPITIAGIPIPSNNPAFLAIVAVHVAAGAVCVVAGVVAMASRKARGRHPWAGSVYYWSLLVVFVSMAVLATLRWAEDYDLFGLGSLSFLAASLGRQARRRRWRHWVQFHIIGMGLSYILLITAFYVDNGKSLPLWRELPQLAFWIFPLAIGTPMILYALQRHPGARPRD
jgi:hypothetical protein